MTRSRVIEKKWARTKFKPLFLLFFIWAAAVLPAPAQNYGRQEIISIEKNEVTAEKIRSLNLDLLMEWENRIYIVADPEDLDALQTQNIPYRLETQKFAPAIPSPGTSTIQGGINGAYHSYQELERDLKALEKAYPQLAKVYELGTSLNKRKIYGLKISDNVALDEEEAEVLILGCHHAREWISVEVPFLLGKYLLENYSRADINRLVNQSEIWIVPLVNPDGLEYSIHFYRYWRKNMRLNSDGSYGIDINRNYGYNWGFDDQGSSPTPSAEIYRGTGPFSEPETQAVRNLFMQKKFQTVVSYHSFSQIILYPWGYTKQPTDRDAIMKQIAAKMSDLMLAANGRRYSYGPAGASLYLTNGDMIDWTFGVAGIPSYTIELPPVDLLHGGFFNAESEIEPIFRENLPALVYLLDWSVQNFKPAKAQPAPSERKRSFLKDSAKSQTHKGIDKTSILR